MRNKYITLTLTIVSRSVLSKECLVWILVYFFSERLNSCYILKAKFASENEIQLKGVTI